MILDADTVPPSPWKNGGGQTRELLRLPASGADPGSVSQDWRLRLSLADITADGPFSAFHGVRRWFAVIEGEGVVLGLAGGERAVRRGDAPLSFDGDEAPGCRLIGGATRDLNLMLQGLDGELAAAPAGAAWVAAWPQRGFFEAASRRLHWPFTGTAAPADGWWIGCDA